MNIIKFTWRNLWVKPLNTGLSVLLIALGVALVTMLSQLSRQMNQRLDRNIKDINMVIGAKGSPLQSILSAVYHVDVPTGNIPLREAITLSKIKKLVRKAIPMALGDGHKGFRIVGTTHEYTKLYEAKVQEGKLWEKTMEATIGHYVQQKTNLKIGDTFAGAHGLTGDDMHLHGDHLYKVVGILEKTGSVLDQLILTNVQSVWAVHAEHDDHEEEAETHAQNDNHDAHAHDHDAHDHNAHDAHAHDAHAHDAHAHDAHGEHEHAHDEHEHNASCTHAHEAPAHDDQALNIPLLGGVVEVDTANKMLTNVLIQYQRDSSGTPSAMADIMLARIMDEHLPSLGYAYPLRERDKLLNSIGIGFDLLKYLAYLFMFVSALSIFISLYTNMKERRYEMALMRVMGSSAAKVSVHVLLEGMLIAALGGLLGILVAHSGMSLLSSLLQAEYRYQFEGFFSFYWVELVIFLVALFLGALASLLPAYQAYKTNISSTLSEG